MILCRGCVGHVTTLRGSGTKRVQVETICRREARRKWNIRDGQRIRKDPESRVCVSSEGVSRSEGRGCAGNEKSRRNLRRRQTLPLGPSASSPPHFRLSDRESPLIQKPPLTLITIIKPLKITYPPSKSKACIIQIGRPQQRALLGEPTYPRAFFLESLKTVVHLWALFGDSPLILIETRF